VNSRASAGTLHCPTALHCTVPTKSVFLFSVPSLTIVTLVTTVTMVIMVTVYISTGGVVTKYEDNLSHKNNQNLESMVTVINMTTLLQ